jgi:hypothetical protein
VSIISRWARSRPDEFYLELTKQVIVFGQRLISRVHLLVIAWTVFFQIFCYYSIRLAFLMCLEMLAT